MNTPQSNPQLVALSTLLQLEKDARHAESPTEFGFIVVNDTHRLCPYDQAVQCIIKSSGNIKIVSVSGVATIDANAPMIQWLRILLKHYVKDSEKVRKIQVIQAEELPTSLKSGWKTWSQGQALWCPFIHTQEGTVESGLLLFRKRTWLDAEKTILGYLMDGYAHAWYALHGTRTHRRPLRRWLIWILIICSIAGALLISIRESVLAPAEVIAQSPLVVTAPIEGAIKQMYVQPNQPIEIGQKLFSLDDTVQKNRYIIAKENLAVAQVDLLRVEQKAFFDPKSKAEIALLRAQVKKSEAELKYVADVLERLEVRAEQAGIAIFADVNDWIGKPVRVGEKVMILAKPELTEIKMWISVADAINLEPETTVLLFLNTNPTHPLDAFLYQTSYEAELTPEGWLAFRAKAKFRHQGSLTRIVMKGTAKIYVKEVKLYYYLLRRPWATVRQYLGL